MPFDAACNLPDAADHSWWASWRPYVLYALASDYAPDAARAPDCSRPGACIEIADRSGNVVVASRELAIVVAGNGRLDAPSGCIARPACADAATCARVIVGAAAVDANDVLVTQP
jgi:hypothetical protein